jgi:hypothetical protein
MLTMMSAQRRYTPEQCQFSGLAQDRQPGKRIV